MSNNRYYSYPNRYACEVIDDILDMHKTHNYAALEALALELRTIYRRMEAALSDQRDIMELTETRSRLKKEVNQLEKKIKDLKKLTGEPEEEEENSGRMGRLW